MSLCNGDKIVNYAKSIIAFLSILNLKIHIACVLALSLPFLHRSDGNKANPVMAKLRSYSSQRTHYLFSNDILQ